MPKRRANGEGNIRKRKDGRWEGRYTVGHDPETGKAIIKNVLGKTQAEVKEKLKKAIEENVGIDYGRAKTYTVGSWLEVWMENYTKVKLRPSTFKTSQGYEPAELVVTAIVGMIGIRPTIEAIKAGKDIALANKETLVTAGHLIMKLAEEYHVRILPVDSEHSAIFQCLHGERENKIAKLLITASGGPFLGNTREELKDVTVEDALKHPNWSMGRKITIDSATLVNKGLEVIEARWLFDVMPEDIEVVVQPQSIIHSMVEFEDGAIKAQLGTADMRLPIQYALYYPERRYLAGDRLDFSKIAGIITSKPDRETFKGLDFAYQAIKTGGSMPTVLNAANECAVAKFLHKDIKFLQIYDIIEACMGEHKTIANPTLEEILETERWVYDYIERQFG